MENEKEEAVELGVETHEEDNSGDELEVLRKKVKTLEAQKEHFRAKALKPKEDLINNQQNGASTREETILISKLLQLGISEEELDKEITTIFNVAKYEGITPLKAINSDYYKNKLELRAQKERSDKAQIGDASGSPIYDQQKVNKMSPVEHKEHYFAELKRLGLDA